MPRKMKNKAADLFAGDGAAASAGAPGLSINARFASAFEDRKRKQDLERAAELGLLPRPSGGEGGGGEEESEEESEDEGEQLDPALDQKITAVIKAIRARDPKMYVPGVQFFAGSDDAAAGGAAAAAEPLAKDGKAAKRGKSAQAVVAAQLVEAAEAAAEEAAAAVQKKVACRRVLLF